MDKINFFPEECRTDNVTAPLFGIIDGDSGCKAYVDYEHPADWEAVVKNKSGKALTFVAIDNCIEILRENGEEENRCDAMLTGNGYLVFIELKNQKEDWIRRAVTEQLETTVTLFGKNHSLEGYSKKLAYACNKRHPHFQSSKMDLMNAFRHKTGFRLVLVNEIVIK